MNRMTSLVRPSVEYADSWAAAVREFTEDGTAMNGSGLWHLDDPLAAGVEQVVEDLRRMESREHASPPVQVPCTYFWIVEDGEFVGYLAMRHELNEWLLNEGGHIGYSIRPSRRRQGHATRALALALGEARAIGLDRVLLTADEDNSASWRAIETNGGAQEDSREDKRRYWIDLRT
jgi:predicted acetyltransferase